jgi:hypothetical protein
MDLTGYRRRLVSAEENRALGACAAFRGDVLIVESENDDIVPHTVIANYVTACIQARSVTSRILAGAEHGLSEEQWQRAYSAILVKWLTEMIGGTDGARPENPAAGSAKAKLSTLLE